MQLEFREEIPLSPAEIYGFMRSPRDWTRLYGSFGEIEDRGDGWYAVPLRRSPFPLVARIVEDVPEQRVAWELSGFWRGHGEINLEPGEHGTRITGQETVRIPNLLGIGRVLEARFFEPRFRAIWESGWRRLRGMAGSEA
ncbi:MAG: SRPBCC family protein [Acidimicrobiia bacterium]|nr:SRPBCC family protein [Acidimicrobiia bacterium]